MSKAIYVLGGMGPQASHEFYRLAMIKAQRDFGATHNEDFPEIVLHSVPVPDFISNEEAKDEALSMLKQRLQAAPAENYGSFAIACNTAHLLAPELQKVTPIPFVSMVEEVAADVGQRSIKRVGLLASPTTVKTELYQKALAGYGIEVILPDQDGQRFVETAIRAVIANNKPEAYYSKLKQIGDKLQEQGAEIIVLGCTELPVIVDDSIDKNFISSTSCLVDALLKNYYLK